MISTTLLVILLATGFSVFLALLVGIKLFVNRWLTRRRSPSNGVLYGNPDDLESGGSMPLVSKQMATIAHTDNPLPPPNAPIEPSSDESFEDVTESSRRQSEDASVAVGDLESAQLASPDPPIEQEPAPSNDRSLDDVAEHSRRPENGSIDDQETAQAFPYEELHRATKNFSEFLGKGGFGSVYKGTLPCGEAVAVKKLEVGTSKQGDPEFDNETSTMKVVKHDNVVKLRGYCKSGDDRLLVYEFIGNKSLKHHLRNNISALDWPKRRKIAIGSAEGLEFLHVFSNPKIIHRDIKSDNILLDEDFVAKLSDFGLAKFLPHDVTYISTDVKGTMGYLDPEFHGHPRKLKAKSDIYAFGVVLWELVTGRPPIGRDGTFLAYWVKCELAREKDCAAIVDPTLLNQCTTVDEMAPMIHCAAACTFKEGKNRPKINQIVEVLVGKKPPDDIWDWDKDMPVVSSESSASPSPSLRNVKAR